jgi:hypothetical protein
MVPFHHRMLHNCTVVLISIKLRYLGSQKQSTRNTSSGCILFLQEISFADSLANHFVYLDVGIHEEQQMQFSDGLPSA